MTANRLEYIDVARTIAIFSVLIYHFPLRNEIWGLTTFISTYFLSLFFFLSGLLTSPQNTTEWIKRKVRRLLIPLLSFYVLLIPFLSILQKTPILTVCHNVLWAESKGGYWFVFTLFATITLVWLIYCIYKKFSLSKWAYIILLILPWVIACGVSIFIPQDISYLLSIPSFNRYYIFFLFGMAIRNSSHLPTYIQNNYIYAFITLCYIVLIAISIMKFPTVNSYFSFMIWLLTNIFGCLCIVETCKRICAKTTVPNWITWISEDSLGIYLGHYFFLYSSKALFLQIPVSPYITLIPYTILLMFVSLVMTRLLHKNTITAKLFLGQ